MAVAEVHSAEEGWKMATKIWQKNLDAILYKHRDKILNNYKGENKGKLVGDLEVGKDVPISNPPSIGYIILLVKLLQDDALKMGYSHNQIASTLRAIFYPNSKPRQYFLGLIYGGGTWDILIPNASFSKELLEYWEANNSRNIAFLKRSRIISVNGLTDIAHTFVGIDCKFHSASIQLLGLLSLGQNIEATSFVGDLGSVVYEYVNNARPADVQHKNVALMNRSFRTYANDHDLRGDVDAINVSYLTHSNVYGILNSYYNGRMHQRRFTIFNGHYNLVGSNLTLNESQVNRLTFAVLNAAIAFAAGKSRALAASILTGADTEIDPYTGRRNYDYDSLNIVYRRVSQWVAQDFAYKVRYYIQQES